MREVSGCDFCGETPSGTFNVLPPKYDPNGEGKRMVLCDHCRDALASILDPLLEANVGDDVEPDAESPSDPGTRTPERRTEAPDATPTSDTTGPSDVAEKQKTATESSTPTDTQTGSSRVPSGYRRVMRFLEGREMPMDREKAVEMVTDAYDLSPEAVEDTIDHAASHGRLKSSQGEIRKP